MARVIALTHRSQEFNPGGENHHDLHSFFGCELSVEVDGNGYYDEKAFFAVEKRMGDELNIDLERVALAKFLSDLLIEAKCSPIIEDDYLNKPVLVIAASNPEILNSIKETTKPYASKPIEDCFNKASDMLEYEDDNDPSLDGLVKRMLSLCVALSGFYRIKTLDFNEGKNQDAYRALINRADEAIEYANIKELTKDAEDMDDIPRLVFSVDKKISEFFESSEKPVECIKSLSYNPVIETVVMEHMDVMVYKTTTIQ